MSTSQPPLPVAFRLKRPYGSEEEFLQGDGSAVWRTGMVLIGAGPRPEGLIVRFELALQDGTPLFRGEGRVVAHRTQLTETHPPGLEIQFMRLDPRGKTMLERLLRQRHASLRPPPPPAGVSDDDAPPMSVPPMSIGPLSVAPLSMPPPSLETPPPSLEALPPSLEALPSSPDAPPSSPANPSSRTDPSPPLEGSPSSLADPPSSRTDPPTTMDAPRSRDEHEVERALRPPPIPRESTTFVSPASDPPSSASSPVSVTSLPRASLASLRSRDAGVSGTPAMSREKRDELLAKLRVRAV